VSVASAAAFSKVCGSFEGVQAAMSAAQQNVKRASRKSADAS
jgi:hypothetical protein